MKHLLIILIIMLCTISCSYQQAKNEAPLKNIFYSNEKFKITLPENHTTGYMWQLNSQYDSKILDYLGSVFHGNEKGVDFNFKTLKKGTTSVKFTLIKYNDTSDIKQFIITVK